MTTYKVVELDGEFGIEINYNDGYTRSDFHSKTYNTRKGAEKRMNYLLELKNGK